VQSDTVKLLPSVGFFTSALRLTSPCSPDAGKVPASPGHFPPGVVDQGDQPSCGQVCCGDEAPAYAGPGQRHAEQVLFAGQSLAVGAKERAAALRAVSIEEAVALAARTVAPTF